jgi:hypothetical protein
MHPAAYAALALVVVLLVIAFVTVVRPALPIWLAGGKIGRGGVPEFRIDENPVHEWLRKAIYTLRVTSISFSGRPLTDERLARLRPALERFPCLRELNLDRTRVTGAGFVHLRGLANLRTVLVEHLRFTRAQMNDLCRSVEGSGVRDEIKFYFHARPRQNLFWRTDKSSIQDCELYVVECDRCRCLLRDDPDKGGTDTFGDGSTLVVIRSSCEYEGAVCLRCKANSTSPLVLCADCHPAGAGSPCPKCGGPTKKVLENELKQAYCAYYDSPEYSEQSREERLQRRSKT